MSSLQPTMVLSPLSSLRHQRALGLHLRLGKAQIKVLMVAVKIKRYRKNIDQRAPSPLFHLMLAPIPFLHPNQTVFVAHSPPLHPTQTVRGKSPPTSHTTSEETWHMVRKASLYCKNISRLLAPYLFVFVRCEKSQISMDESCVDGSQDDMH